MYKVVVNKLTFGRRTFKKGDTFPGEGIQNTLLNALEKSGKVEKVQTGKAKK